MKTLTMLLAIGTLVSGHWAKEACAEKDRSDNGVEKVTAKGDGEETEKRKAKKARERGKRVGRVAGPDGVDSRIKLTPVTDGSLDWTYKATIANLNLLGPSERLHILQLPDWVPVDKREDPEAKYYLYHSNHGGGSIKMHWAKSMEQIVSGNVRKVTAITIESSRLVQPPELTVRGEGGYVRTNMTVELTGALHTAPLGIGHISFPSIHIDHEKKCFYMLLHGFDKGALGDLPREVVKAGGGLTKMGWHTGFAATSPYGRNFNGHTINGIPCGGYEGYGPVMSAKGYFHDNRNRFQKMTTSYSDLFKHNGRFYTVARSHEMSRAPRLHPFKPAANGRTEGSETYWEALGGNNTYNNAGILKDWLTGTSKRGDGGVIMREDLLFVNHPNNPSGMNYEGGNPKPACRSLSDTHFEYFFPFNKSICRVVVDATSEDWRDWHLEHDEDGVIFDVVVDARIFDEYNAKHRTSYSLKGGMGGGDTFVNNEGTAGEQLYVLSTYKLNGPAHGGVHIGLIRMDKVADSDSSE